jgi:hypothetical protein
MTKDEKEWLDIYIKRALKYKAKNERLRVMFLSFGLFPLESYKSNYRHYLDYKHQAMEILSKYGIKRFPEDLLVNFLKK